MRINDPFRVQEMFNKSSSSCEYKKNIDQIQILHCSLPFRNYNLANFVVEAMKNIHNYVKIL